MTDFADLLREFAAKVEQRTQIVFLNTVSAAHESITVGSAVTGSPGQPVGQYGPGYHPGEVGGELRASWQIERESDTSFLIATDSPYAVQNEYGISATNGPYVQRSTVGGRHSVALTVAGLDKIVEAEAKKAGAE